MSQEVTPTPFAVLVETEKAIRSLLKKSPPETEPHDDWLGLAFLSGDQVLLTPLDEIHSILSISTFAYIPGVKPWLLGMATYRDDIFPVTDLAGFMGQKKSSLTKHTRLLVIDYQGEKAGLMVNRVMGLHRLPKEQRFNKYQMTQDSLYEPFLIGHSVDINTTLPIISCNAIVNHPRFRDVLVKVEVLNDLH
ncbi:chemotaxis protein CheW [Candidatus Berkiella aquae]|uniref:CheW-like domain protein n=1 Tax=Candidatus Berkiella aquae TaxID=295108 RepID=A0A0Q9YXE1_9GAMM|nr:chemotaxis protein CheW [Candidatus Berkiella aquae]MCS5712595.1 chemotaxis protein CheW [Candidatus Berkiella aquae]